MRSVFVVDCVCGAAVGCDPPEDSDTVGKVECIVCGRELDARNGHWNIRPIVIKEEEGINLLAVG